jgi:hypothetical protein
MMSTPVQYDSGGNYRKYAEPNPLVFRKGRILGVDAATADHLVATNSERFIRVDDVSSDELNLEAWSEQPADERVRQVRDGLLDSHLSAVENKAVSGAVRDAIDERRNAGGT